MNRRLFLMFALAALAACGENGVTGTTTVNIVGSWRLQSVNGSPVPYTQQTAGSQLEILSGGVVISANGAFTTPVVQRTTTNGSSSVNVSTTYGTVDISGPTVLFKRQDVQGAPDIPVELTSDSMTFSQNNLTLLFVRS